MKEKEYFSIPKEDLILEINFLKEQMLVFFSFPINYKHGNIVNLSGQAFYKTSIYISVENLPSNGFSNEYLTELFSQTELAKRMRFLSFNPRFCQWTPYKEETLDIGTLFFKASPTIQIWCGPFLLEYFSLPTYRSLRLDFSLKYGDVFHLKDFPVLRKEGIVLDAQQIAPEGSKVEGEYIIAL